MAYEKIKSETYSQLGGINVKASAYVNTIQEMRDITNLNFFVPGSLTKRPGTTAALSATVIGRITGLYEFQKLNGASYLVATANTNAYVVTNSFSTFRAGLSDGKIFDFVTFVDRLFMGNGSDFFKYDGNQAVNFSLPPGNTLTTSLTGSGSLNGTYQYSYGYLNDRGYLGPAINIATASPSSQQVVLQGFTAPTGFGITAIAIYRTSAGGVDLFRTAYIAPGSSQYIDTGDALTNDASNDNLYFTLAPKYLELYNNQLFLAGFSSALSTAYWSQVGEPEGIPPDYFAEFRTNDGDRVTGMKSFAGALIVTKEKSFHKLTGDNPSNFLIQEISDQYGCLSNRTLVQFEDRLMFLDQKGVVEYNGANIRIISNRVEPIFLSMNVQAATENACSIHYRQYNEVWFCIPCNGATINNCIVVYDYVADAWTKYEGLNVSSVALARQFLTSQTPFYGGYTGNIFYFGASFFGDNGQAMTCMMKTRYLAPMGQTTEQQFRRFYLNVNPVIGITQPITIQLRPNYGETIAATRTMYQAPFQSRIDYGIPARSLSAEIIHSSATLALRVDGFTIESRFQRAV